MMKKAIFLISLIFFSSVLRAEIPTYELRDIPLFELAKLTSEKTNYNLVFPSGLEGRISYFQGLDAKGADFEQNLFASLKISGFDFEIKDKTIFVKKNSEIRIFDDSKIYYFPFSPDSDFVKNLFSDVAFFQKENQLFVNTDAKTAQKIRSALRQYQDEKILNHFVRIHSFSKPLERFLEEKTEFYSYDPTTGNLVFSAPKSQKNFLLRTIALFDSAPEIFNLNFVVVSASKSDIESREFGFIFGGGSLSLDLFKTALGFDSFLSATQSLNLFANLVDSTNSSKVLSRPFLQIATGEEATFSSGKEYPFVSSVIDQTTGQSITNIERKNVGLSVSSSLFKTPNGLQLKINQSLSSISQIQVSNQTDLVTNNQTLSTTIYPEPGKIYAIGGLSDSRNSNSNSGFGFLKGLNRSTSKEGQETIILVTLTQPKEINLKSPEPTQKSLEPSKKPTSFSILNYEG